MMPFDNYGDRWRLHRRLIGEQFNPKPVEVFKPQQLKHMRRLLAHLLDDPQRVTEHTRYAVGAVIMEIVYGLEVRRENVPHLQAAEAVVSSVSEIAIPGGFLVENIPWLRYVPEWFPCAGFQRKARIWYERSVEMRETCFQAAKDLVKSGMTKPTYVASFLHDLGSQTDLAGNDEGAIRDSAAAAFVGGSDTTTLTLHIFILEMAMFPDIQKKAQDELDSVLEGSRLVDFGDRPSLPYTEAVYKEVLRWHPLAPSGFPRATAEDDVIGEYFIPKGTIVLGNTWDLLRDETEFGSDSGKFMPERYLNRGVRDPLGAGAFGYGRRICPGRFFAENEIFIAIASILQVFDISFPPDTPVRAHFDDYFLSGLAASPQEFECLIRPRSTAAKQLILQG